MRWTGFNGGYAEYALLPNSLLMRVTTTLPWDVLAWLPESALTAQGSLNALGVEPVGEGRLLIHGGTSFGGMAAASIASGYGSGSRPRLGGKARSAR